MRPRPVRKDPERGSLEWLRYRPDDGSCMILHAASRVERDVDRWRQRIRRDC